MVLVLLFLLLTAAGARAEPSPPDRAIAERLYEQGQKQLADGYVSAACESFAESLRLDPGTGILLNLAACHETMGRLASAWVEFREALTAVRREGRADRMRYAQEHLAAIEPRLAHLTIDVPEMSEGDAPSITLDGRTLGPAVWGVALPIDAGWHEVVAQTMKRGPWRATVKIHDGENRRLAVPADFGTASAVVELMEAGPPVPAPAAPVEGANSRQSRGRRIAGGALGAAGLAFVVVGGYFGLQASSLWDSRNRECPMEMCSAEGLRFGERADTSATIATWTIGAGVVTLGAAVLIFVSGGGSSAPPPAVARVLQRLRITPNGQVALGGVF